MIFSDLKGQHIVSIEVLDQVSMHPKSNAPKTYDHNLQTDMQIYVRFYFGSDLIKVDKIIFLIRNSCIYKSHSINKENFFSKKAKF